MTTPPASLDSDDWMNLSLSLEFLHRHYADKRDAECASVLLNLKQKVDTHLQPGPTPYERN